MHDMHPSVPEGIRDTKVLDDEIEAALKGAIEQFNETFAAGA